MIIDLKITTTQELFATIKNEELLKEYFNGDKNRFQLDYNRMGLLGYSVGGHVVSRYVNSFPKMTTGAPYHYPYPGI